MRCCQWVPESLAICRPCHKGEETHIISLFPAALLGFLYSNCGFLSPFLLHWIPQMVFQNSSHNYCGTTVNSLQFLWAHYRLVLKMAVCWPLATQLWCDGIWGANLWVKRLASLDFKAEPEFILLPVSDNGGREWKLVFLQVGPEAQTRSLSA